MSGARAPFITFEGGDGAGKTTQINFLADTLSLDGLDVVTTREPGGAPGSERLRKLLVEGEPGAWTPMAEALMMYAARAEHLSAHINPARAAGSLVLCDRFSDSTRAYQGYAGQVALDDIETLDRIVVGDNGPDLTFILDIPFEEGLARAGKRKDDEDRFERKGSAFQEKVRQGFLDIARRNPARCRVIDARLERSEVARQIAGACAPIIHNWRRSRG